MLPALLMLATATPVADAGTPPALEPVVVTATGAPRPRDAVPAAVDVLDGDDLRRARPALSLAEALPRLPGVTVRDRQNQAQDLQLSIRGYGARASFGVRGLRLLVDGIPASMPDGQGQLSHALLGAADRVELLRGPFSALQGNASGGVLAIDTRAPPAVPEAGASATAGGDGLWHAEAGWRGAVGDAWGLRVDASIAGADGWRRHSAWRRDLAQALARGQTRGGGDWTALASHLDLAADDPQGLTAAQVASDPRAASAGALAFDTRKTVRQAQAGARLSQPLGGSQSLALVAYAGRRDTFQVLSVPVAAQASPTSGGGVIDLARDYGGLDLRWTWSPSDALSLTVGAAHERAGERRRGYENFIGATLGVRGALRRDEANRVTGDDLFAQLGWAFAPGWRLEAGLRRSRVRFVSEDDYVRPGNPDDSGTIRYARSSPALGLAWRPDPRLTVFANAGAGFETPTFAELAYRPDGGSGLNAALRPARSHQAELGLRWRERDWRLEATLFEARTEDELVVASSSGGRSRFANGGRTRRQGAELAVEMDLAPDWALSASATWLEARYRDDVFACAAPPCAGPPRIAAGRRLPGTAARAAWAELRWSPGPRTDLLLEARATSRFFADDANTAAAPGHALLDLAIEHRVPAGRGQWRLWARLSNLADRASIGSVIVNEGNGRWFEPAPGRRLLLGASFDAPW